VRFSAAKQAPLPGTRPEGTHDEREAAARVHEMFDRIAPRYDLGNRIISGFLDQYWRRQVAGRFLDILSRPDARALDLCCGTGDLAFALDRIRLDATCRSGGQGAQIIGGDFTQSMLDCAQEKARRRRRAVFFVNADALNLPFLDGSFDLVTLGFGFRNLTNYEGGLREIARVLKPGGKVGILDFSEPGRGPKAGLFRFYFRHVLPRIGGAIAGSYDAYEYLPRSVTRFPSPAGLVALMEAAGFTSATFESLAFGSVNLHSARRS
jgi:demethylmenaquinone methyltransferase / 2-methoxy-6-polyprenyl-1,4-benzoquinol methylase